MAAAARTYTFRLTAEGLDKLKRDLDALGPAGQQAFQKVQQFSPQFEDAFKRAQKSVDEARKSIEAANENVPRGFAKVGEAAERLEASTKRATRGLNDVRGTMELLGPLAGEAGAGFGNLVRTVGNFADAFGVAAALIRANPIGVLVTVLGLAATAFFTLGRRTEENAEVQKKFSAAVKEANELIETQAEKVARLAEQKRNDTIRDLQGGRAIYETELKRAEDAQKRLMAREEALGRDPRGANPEAVAEVRRSLEGIGGAIEEKRQRLADIDELIRKLRNPEELGAAREQDAKALEDLQKESMRQYLEGIDKQTEEYEKNLTEQAKLTKSNHERMLEVRKDYVAAEMKLAEEDAKVQQEAAKATTEFQIKEAERRERELFGPGAMRAVQDYWDGIAQHGRRAGQFVSNSVLRPMEDSLTKFLSGGKVKFRDFFDSVKMGLARLAAQDLIGGLGSALGIGSGGGSALWSGVSAAGSFLSDLFFAEGGRPRVGQWAVVGEEGPELIKFDAPAKVYSNDNSKVLARQLAAQGEGRDTELVHLMREELPIIRRVLGPGKVNPRTGLWGFDFGLGGGDPANDDGSTGGYAAGNQARGGEVTNYDDYGEFGITGIGSPRGFTRGLDDRVVEALDRWGLNVGSAIARGMEPSFFDYVADVLSGTLGKGLQAAAGLFGVPGVVLATLLGFARAELSVGRASFTGLGGMASDALAGRGFLGDIASGRTTVADALGSVLDRATDRINSFGDRLGDRLGGAFAGLPDTGRFGGIDQSSASFALEALSLSGSQRGINARDDLAADLGTLRGSLSDSWRDGPELTGRNVMSSLPRFHSGGSFTVKGTGDKPVAFMAEGGEQVSVRTSAQARDVGSGRDLAEVGRDTIRVNTAGFEAMLKEMRLLRDDIGTLGRRLQAAMSA